MMNGDISDRRWYEYLAEKNEQESTEEEYKAFYDEYWDWKMDDERERYRD
jgi:hypothetical protein